MATCSNPNSITGGIEITSGPYANGALVIYQCSTGYAMSGDPYVTCNSGTFTGTYPTCNLQDTNSVTVNLSDSSDDIPTWVFYLIAALIGVLMVLFIVCIFVCCCQLCGYFGPGGLFGAPQSSVCGCCRRNRYDETGIEYQRQCKTFPRRYLYDEHGRRFHYDDVGRTCYYNHKHQNGKTVVYPMHEKISSEESTKSFSLTTVNEAEKKTAKDLGAWRPHVHPVRNINTSTK